MKGSWNGVAGSVVVRDLQVVVGLRCGLRANCPCFACALRAAEHFAPPRGCAAGVVCCWDSLQHHAGPRIDEHDQGGKGHKGKRKLLKAQGTCACPAALTTAASNIQPRTDHVKAATRRAGHGRSPLLACGLVESLSGDSCRLLDSLEVPEEVTLFRLLVCSSGEGLPVTTPRFLAPPLSGLIPLPLPLPLLLLRLLGLLGSVSGESGARGVGFDSRPLSGCCRLLLAPDAGDSSWASTLPRDELLGLGLLPRSVGDAELPALLSLPLLLLLPLPLRLPFALPLPRLESGGALVVAGDAVSSGDDDTVVLPPDACNGGGSDDSAGGGSEGAGSESSGVPADGSDGARAVDGGSGVVVVGGSVSALASGSVGEAAVVVGAGSAGVCGSSGSAGGGCADGTCWPGAVLPLLSLPLPARAAPSSSEGAGSPRACPGGSFSYLLMKSRRRLRCPVPASPADKASDAVRRVADPLWPAERCAGPR